MREFMRRVSIKARKREKDDEKDHVRDILQKWPKLIAWLEEKEYFTAPASKNHHGAREGGLIEHSLQVAYELERITVKMGLRWERPESPEIIGLLHDVCKMDDYHTVSIGDEPTKTGIERNKERLYPGHGDNSLIMLMGLIDLTEEEKMCIRYHMGAFTEKSEWEFYSRAVRRYPNVLWTHTADMIASQIKGV